MRGCGVGTNDHCSLWLDGASYYHLDKGVTCIRCLFDRVVAFLPFYTSFSPYLNLRNSSTRSELLTTWLIIFTTLKVYSANDKFMLFFFLFFPENIIRHFMQIVSLIFQNVACLIFYPASSAFKDRKKKEIMIALINIHLLVIVITSLFIIIIITIIIIVFNLYYYDFAIKKHTDSLYYPSFIFEQGNKYSEHNCFNV